MDNYLIIYNGFPYNLNKNKVKELLKISECKESGQTIKVKWLDGRVAIGQIIDFKGYNPLMPADVYVPIEWRLRSEGKIIEINFREIQTIDIIK